MAPTANQVAAVKALASQAGSGPAARQSLIASGAMTKLLKHLTSKTGAIASQSALALSLLASDPTSRPSVWEHRQALVPALVQTLKTGGPLTLAHSLATLAVLIEHIPEAGAAVIRAKGVVPILRIAQTSPQGPREAAGSALDAFHLQASWRHVGSAERHTCDALHGTNGAFHLVEPLIRALSNALTPVRGKVFALRVLRWLPREDQLVQALRRPMVTNVLVEFALEENVDAASAALEVLSLAFGNRDIPDQVVAGDAAYWDSAALRRLWETLPSHLQSRHEALVQYALVYVNRLCGMPGVVALSWFRQCVRHIPHLLQSPNRGLKYSALFFALRVWTDRSDANVATSYLKMLEELRDGPTLPLIIGLLDPRPRADASDTGITKERSVANLAARTCAFVAASGGELPLPSVSTFHTSAEIADRAGLTLLRIAARPWSFHVLAKEGFYTLAAELLEEKILPRGAAGVLGFLFSREDAVVAPALGPLKRDLAEKFLAGGYLQYLLDCSRDWPHPMAQFVRDALEWVGDFVAQRPDDTHFSKEEAVRAIVREIQGPNLDAYDIGSWPEWDAREGCIKGLLAIVSQRGGLEAFWRGGGVEWALASLRIPQIRDEATKLLRAGLEGRGSEASTAIPIARLRPVVRCALTPPTRCGSMEAMRLLCSLVAKPGAESSPGSAGNMNKQGSSCVDHPEGISPTTAVDGENHAGRDDYDIFAELARQGAVEAAVMHFKKFPPPPSHRGVFEPSGLSRLQVTRFLCWLSLAPEAFPKVQSAGALEVLVDLSRMDEGDEMMYARVAIAALTISHPAACAPLRKLGAITPLAQQLKDPSNEDIDIATLAVTALTRDENGEAPAPHTVGELLAAGAVPAVLRLLAVPTPTGARCLLIAFDLLHLISQEPPGLAAIAATRCALPLMTALCVAWGKMETPELRSNILGVISNVIGRQPGQGGGFLSAGIAGELAKSLRSPRVRMECALAMDLVEKLVRFNPGAGDTLMAEGVLKLIHDIAVGAALAPPPGPASDRGLGEETLPAVPAIAILKVEAAHANALLGQIAGNCGDAEETATGVGDRVPDMQGRGSADGPPPRPKAMATRSSRRVCCMCGVVSEKHFRVCSRCREARYCGRDCQKAHWPVHKLECRG